MINRQVKINTCLEGFLKMPSKKHEHKAPKKLAHIGIAVHSIEQALPFYRDLLKLTHVRTEDVPSEHVRVAFLSIGETFFELLQPLNEQSAIHTFLERQGEGIHHIALDVKDIDARLRTFKKKGIKLIHEQAKRGANDTKIAFLHPKVANGVLFELVESKREGQ